MADEIRVGLIDFQSIARPIYETNANRDVTRTAIEIVQRVRNLASGNPHVAICCDSRKSFRKAIDPTYKANRGETPAPYLHQLTEAVETLRIDGFPIWEAEGFEADDIIGCAIHALRAEPVSFLVVSFDKDLRQLVSDEPPRVTVFSPGLGTKSPKEFDVNAVVEEYGVQPWQLLHYLALVGDSSDNVQGAKGIGPKTATAMLQKFGTVDAILEETRKPAHPFTDKTLESLREFESRVLNVMTMIQIRKDGCDIDFTAVLKPRRALDSLDVEDVTESITDAFGPFDGQAAATSNETHQQIAESMAAAVAPTIQPIIDVPPSTSAAPAVSNASQSTPPPSPQQPQQPQRPAKKDIELDEPEGSTALARVSAGALEELQPHSLKVAYEFSKAMFVARLFSAYGTAEGIFSTIVAGREIGLPAMAALRSFHIIDGKSCMAASAIHSLMLRAPVVEYFYCKERTPAQATFVGKRRGDHFPEIVLTYSVEDARIAWTKDPKKFLDSGWGKNPADMCVARAATKLARLIAPDVLEGHYAVEEFDQ
jgi:5'-3' exonuclease